MDDAVAVAILGVVVVAALVITLFNCVCFDDGKKGASTGREDNLNNNRGAPKATADVGNSGSDAVESTSDTGLSSKRNTTQRELPKIPFEDINLGDLYAMVDEMVQSEHVANGGLGYNSELSHPGTSNGHLAQADRSPETGGPLELWSANNTKHAYDRLLRNQVSEDRDTDTDNYDDPAVIYSTPDNAGNRSSRIGATSFDAGPPPVPEKRFDPGESSSSSAGGYPSSATARAIAGRSSAGSIPFMTSPLGTSQELVYADDQAEPGLHPRYSSISVREPIRELLRAELEAAGSSPGRDVVTDVESTYWNVQDDEMYAEIQSAQNSANSSVTYSKIDPPTILEPPFPMPPAPPTVESLRNVAHSQAHSRNASSSSFTSDTDYPHSPISERSCGSFANASAACPTILDVSELYSTVDKSKKTRASIHVMEASATGPSLDDLYAKVHKGNSLSVNRHPLAPTPASTGARPKLHNLASSGIRHDKAHVSPHDSSSSSSSSSKMMAADESRGATGIRGVATPSLLRRNSSTEDPRYEKISDRSAVTGNTDDDVSEVGYETVKIPAGSSSAAATTSSKVAGYETIRGDADNYEEIVEPNYEMVKNPRRHGGEVDDDPSVDPGYERIVNGPNYETVRYNHHQQATRGHEETHAVTVEPRYWLIDNRRRPTARADDADDPFYERISGRDEDVADPNYEKVKTGSELSSESSEPGYESVKKKPSTAVSQEEGYAKVREPIASSKNHGYEKLNRVSSVSPTDSGPRPPTLHGGQVTSHSERVYAEPSMTIMAPLSAVVGPVAVAGDSKAVSAHGVPVDQDYRQGRVLEESFQDDVLL